MTEQIQNLSDQYARLHHLFRKIPEDQRSKPIRKGGWSVNQIVHHISDAHLHGYMRIKWILLEDKPTLKTFDQDNWVAASDGSDETVESALDLFSGVCSKWSALMRTMSESDLHRVGIHPEAGEIDIKYIFDYFYTHGESHLNQLQEIVDQSN